MYKKLPESSDEQKKVLEKEVVSTNSGYAVLSADQLSVLRAMIGKKRVQPA